VHYENLCLVEWYLLPFRVVVVLLVFKVDMQFVSPDAYNPPTTLGKWIPQGLRYPSPSNFHIGPRPWLVLLTIRVNFPNNNDCILLLTLVQVLGKWPPPPDYTNSTSNVYLCAPLQQLHHSVVPLPAARPELSLRILFFLECRHPSLTGIQSPRHILGPPRRRVHFSFK
jgi:hypothetical protein